MRKKLEAIEQEKLRLETEYNKQLSTTPKEIKVELNSKLSKAFEWPSNALMVGFSDSESE